MPVKMCVFKALVTELFWTYQQRKLGFPFIKR